MEQDVKSIPTSKDSEQFYVIHLSDYFDKHPHSKVKHYFGTLADIDRFMESYGELRSNTQTLRAYESYKAGDHTVTHIIGNTEYPLLSPVELLDQNTVTLPSKEFHIENVYGFEYTFRIKEATVEQAVLKHDNFLYHCIKPTITDTMEFNAHDNYWAVLDEWFWGHPGVLDILYTKGIQSFDNLRLFETNAHSTLTSNLWLVENVYSEPQEAQIALTHPENLTLQGVWEDILGDG